jgi:hypothetical protein
LNPTNYFREIEASHHRYPGQCIYHLSKTHLTSSCFIKRDCEKLLAEGPSSSPQVSSSPPTSICLRHITDETFKDASTDELLADYEDSSTNDTNDAVLAYFAYSLLTFS